MLILRRLCTTRHHEARQIEGSGRSRWDGQVGLMTFGRGISIVDEEGDLIEMVSTADDDAARQLREEPREADVREEHLKAELDTTESLRPNGRRYHTSPGNASSPGSASAPTQPLSVHSWRRNGVQNERIRSQQSV